MKRSVAGTGQSSGRPSGSTTGIVANSGKVVGFSTDPQPANPNKRPAPAPPVHVWENGSYCPSTGRSAGTNSGNHVTSKAMAQTPNNSGLGKLDSNRSASVRPTTPGRIPDRPGRRK